MTWGAGAVGACRAALEDWRKVAGRRGMGGLGSDWLRSRRSSLSAGVRHSLVAAALIVPTAAAPVAAEPPPARVLLLAADSGASPGLLLFSVALRNELAVLPNSELNVEYLDLVH